MERVINCTWKCSSVQDPLINPRINKQVETKMAESEARGNKRHFRTYFSIVQDMEMETRAPPRSPLYVALFIDAEGNYLIKKWLVKTFGYGVAAKIKSNHSRQCVVLSRPRHTYRISRLSPRE